MTDETGSTSRSPRTLLDPHTSIAFALHSAPGVYALLLGSGISRAAGIPTGHELFVALLHRAAALGGVDADTDPFEWYHATTGTAPTYARLVEQLAPTPAARRDLLRPYFEPTPEEVGQGLKTPTRAHRAIARLVASGTVRVIVTTNFDRLLEDALAAERVQPTVITSADAIKGASPLPHAACTLVKLHGDYLDARLRNTADELGEFEPELHLLLDRILDEYGLIVCGWSAEWDTAICSAIRATPHRRYPVYWTERGERSLPAQDLITLRDAIVVTIADADTFFETVETRTQALGALEQHPLTPTLAGAEMRRLLDPPRPIAVHEVVRHETERLVGALSSMDRFPVELGRPTTIVDVDQRMRDFIAASATALALTVNGVFWGGDAHRDVWPPMLSRLVNYPRDSSGSTWLLGLQLLPALLAYYAGGIAAIAGGQYEVLVAIWRAPGLRDTAEERRPIVETLVPDAIVDQGLGRQLPMLGGENRLFVPCSELLYQQLREPLREVLPDDTDYEDAFDRFEYLTALVQFDEQTRPNVPRLLIGRFGWKARHTWGRPMPVRVRQELEGESVPPFIAAGAFDGDVALALQAATGLEELLGRLAWR